MAMRQRNYIGSRMESQGISNGFLANRLYLALGYDSPKNAEAFISQVKKSSDFGRHFRVFDSSGCDERKNEFNRKVNIIHYALGFSQEEVNYDKYPPEGSIANETIISFLDALKNPSKANLEVLLKLELNEKLSLLNKKGFQSIINAVNDQIQQRNVRK